MVASVANHYNNLDGCMKYEPGLFKLEKLLKTN